MQYIHPVYCTTHGWVWICNKVNVIQLQNYKLQLQNLYISYQPYPKERVNHTTASLIVLSLTGYVKHLLNVNQICEEIRKTGFVSKISFKPKWKNASKL